MSRSLAVVWDWPALATFYRLPLHTATIIDRAVVRFAEHGEGQVGWEAPHHILVAGFYRVLLNIDFETETITVIRLFRVR